MRGSVCAKIMLCRLPSVFECASAVRHMIVRFAKQMRQPPRVTDSTLLTLVDRECDFQRKLFKNQIFLHDIFMENFKKYEKRRLDTAKVRK